jgi:uncharacterized protein YegP (UPF0339 family)
MDPTEIYQSDKDQQWYFRIRARNGLVVAQSEGYQDRRNAVKGLNAAKTALASTEVRTLPEDEAIPDIEVPARFAREFAPKLRRWRPGTSAVTLQRDEISLMDVVLQAVEDGWTIIPPAPAGDAEP